MHSLSLKKKMMGLAIIMEWERSVKSLMTSLNSLRLRRSYRGIRTLWAMIIKISIKNNNLISKVRVVKK
jgi:hypothetical protein